MAGENEFESGSVPRLIRAAVFTGSGGAGWRGGSSFSLSGPEVSENPRITPSVSASAAGSRVAPGLTRLSRQVHETPDAVSDPFRVFTQLIWGRNKNNNPAT